jgi:LysR family nitrogen assimilation transcriptional regulator
LTYFRKVIEAGNMTAAARQLNLAQPALGAQMRQLETELGVSLLVRHSRGIMPTAAGSLLYERAQEILESVEQAARDVRTLNSQRHNQLRIGFNPSTLLVLSPDVIMDTRVTMPGVSVSLVEERTPVLLDALEHNQVDIAFLYLYNLPERPGLTRRAVIEEDLLLVTAPSLQPQEQRAAQAPHESQEPTVSLAEALRYDLAIGGERGDLRNIVESEAQRLSLKVKIAYELQSGESTKLIVARGTAATILPYSLAAEELKSGALVGRRIDRPALTRMLYVVRPHVHASILDDARVQAHVDQLIGAILTAIGPWARRLS